MSWSISKVGKSDKLGAAIKAELANYKCSEPEESIKNAAGEFIAKALDGNIPATAVKVTAFGSQSTMGGHGGEPDAFSNTLKIEIEQLYGFID